MATPIVELRIYPRSSRVKERANVVYVCNATSCGTGWNTYSTPPYATWACAEVTQEQKSSTRQTSTNSQATSKAAPISLADRTRRHRTDRPVPHHGSNKQPHGRALDASARRLEDNAADRGAAGGHLRARRAAGDRDVDIVPVATPPAAAQEGGHGLRRERDGVGVQRVVLSRLCVHEGFDRRGVRPGYEVANEAWRQGNATHAQDMFGIVSGTVLDTTHLLDVLGGYLFEAGDGLGASPSGENRHIDSNLVLGVSLGGHSAWQLLFADPRVTGGVVVIGSPDYMNLIQDRARLSKLQTFTVDSGVSFLGSKDFPRALIEACKKYDPKAILFSTGEISTQPSTSEQDRLRAILDSTVRGKRFQVLSGGADKLVPYNAGQQFLEFFKNASSGWYKDGSVYVEDNVYPGVGHEFTVEMRQAAVRFVLDTVGSLDVSGQIASPKI
ncbi:hypothetical protein CHU98_g8497 [Xylaria longipes]|nr:hypothetical protein CHU98_g8497 [Xylaria longipes]